MLLEQARRVDRACTAFETAFQAGQQPRKALRALADDALRKTAEEKK